MGEDEEDDETIGGNEDYGVPQDSATTILPFDYATESSVAAPAAAPAPAPEQRSYTEPQDIPAASSYEYTNPQDTLTLDTYGVPQDSSTDTKSAKTGKPPPRPKPRPRTSTNEAFGAPMGPSRGGISGK